MTVETAIEFNVVIGVCFFAWGEPAHSETTPEGQTYFVWSRQHGSPAQGQVIVVDDKDGILVIAGATSDPLTSENMSWGVPPSATGDVILVIGGIVADATVWMASHGGPMPMGPMFSGRNAKDIVEQMRASASSCVYFIQSVNGGPIKIGRSGNVDERVARLQTANAFPLRVVARMPGKVSVERNMHALFAKDRIRPDGEWFNPSPELLAFIREIGGTV